MPNWCYNRVAINGSKEDVEAFKALVRGSSEDENAFSFQNILPCPEELLNDSSTTYGGDNSEENDKLRATLMDKYGYSSWYDWRVSNWGTKWDISHASSEFYDDESAEWTFDTAWCAPDGIYYELASRFPELHISWFYDEPGMQVAGYLNNPNH